MIDRVTTVWRGVARCGLAMLVSCALIAPPLAAQTGEGTTQQPDPAAQKPVEQQAAEQKPAEQKPAEQKPAEQKPEEQQKPPAEQQPAAEQQAAEQKPAEQKPAEQKPAEQKPQAAEKPAEPKTAAQQPAQTKDTKTMGSEAIVSAEALARDPRQHYGKTVMVKAEVARVLGSHMFLLDEDAIFAGPDILVLVPKGFANLSADHEVQVRGTVRPFVVAEIEREYDWFGDGEEVEIDLRGRPVIVADSVRRADDSRELAGLVMEAPRQTAAPAERPLRVTAGELAEHPERYIGKRVSVRAEVEDVHNRQLFTLDEDRLFVGPDVIVYARDGRAVVDDNQIVTVTGVVHKFVDSELFGTATWFEPWFNDLDPTGQGLVRSRPVIVAETIASQSGAQLYRTGEPSEERTAAEGEERTAGTSGTAEMGAMEIGQQLTITGTIHSMATDRAFWLQVEGREAPLMVIVDAGRMTELSSNWKPEVNQRVQVSGTVKEVPGRSDAVTVSDWGMPVEHARRFSEQRAYLYADAVTLASR